MSTLSAGGDCAAIAALALYASRQPRINDRASTRLAGGGFAAVASGGTQLTLVGTEARVGSILSKGAVDLRDRSRVEGFVTTGSTLSPGSAVTITGGSRQNAQVSPLGLEAFTVQFPEAEQSSAQA